MKTEWFPVTLALLCAGCQTSRPLPKPVSEPLPLAAASSPSGIRLPETLKTYAVGAYVDPEDESVRHEAHLIHRLERAAQWNLAPTTAEDAVALPVPASPAPFKLSEPIITPLPPAPVPAPLPISNAASIIAPPPLLPPPAAIPTPAAAALAPPADPEPALMPNADGVIDLATVEQSADADEPNPFAVRIQPPGAIRELTVRVSGVFAGARPGALVNERPIMVGDTTESLTLVRVESDAAIFRSGTRLLRLLVNTQPVRIRFMP